MTLHVELSPDTSIRVVEAARHRGIDASDLVESIVAQYLPQLYAPQPPLDERNAAAIAWLDQRLIEEATEDPEVLRSADEDLAQLKISLNTNRDATGERRVFP